MAVPLRWYSWVKESGGLPQFKVHGQGNVRAVYSFEEALGYGMPLIAYNLIPLGNLLEPSLATS